MEQLHNSKQEDHSISLPDTVFLRDGKCLGTFLDPDMPKCPKIDCATDVVALLRRTLSDGATATYASQICYCM
ncbi:hypothetical protein GOP47_0002856 [Adiantum capillus-veneris]|uniref:Uncharacterized protein n=1 Tax=Adiantum capillus-veneris TaxID=13818 RepID=A0A9D4VBB9_ADICA|nr:hypothetical protein GOP47_0002856 [Adiantum capillus-veneris]